MIEESRILFVNFWKPAWMGLTKFRVTQSDNGGVRRKNFRLRWFAHAHFSNIRTYSWAFQSRCRFWRNATGCLFRYWLSGKWIVKVMPDYVFVLTAGCLQNFRYRVSSYSYFHLVILSAYPCIFPPILASRCRSIHCRYLDDHHLHLGTFGWYLRPARHTTSMDRSWYVKS